MDFGEIRRFSNELRRTRFGQALTIPRNVSVSKPLKDVYTVIPEKLRLYSRLEIELGNSLMYIYPSTLRMGLFGLTHH